MTATPRRRTSPAKTTTAPAPAPRARRTAQAAVPAPAGVDLSIRRQIEYIGLDELVPYDYNPRDNSKAIAAVANSIRTFGFLIPVVVDANNVLVAGHTRTEAAKTLGMDAVPALRVTDLTQEQVNAFRLIDNKVAEVATWDYDLLAGEIGKLSELGLDFTQFGWSQNEIDCLAEVVAEECLTAGVTVSETVQRETAQRRAPLQARVTIGELVFFIPAASYRNWVDGIRQLCNFSEEDITRELKRRLGMLED